MAVQAHFKMAFEFHGGLYREHRKHRASVAVKKTMVEHHPTTSIKTLTLFFVHSFRSAALLSSASFFSVESTTTETKSSFAELPHACDKAV